MSWDFFSFCGGGEGELKRHCTFQKCLAIKIARVGSAKCFFENIQNTYVLLR